MGNSEEIDLRLVRALAHPLRVRILEILSAQVASPIQIARFLEEKVSMVSYHIDVLRKYECVEEVRRKHRRGAVEHFYRATPISTLDSRNWRMLPASLRSSLSGASLDAFTSRAIEALQGGTFDTLEGSFFKWQPLTIDQHGWVKLLEILADVEARFDAVEAESKRRLGNANGLSVVAAVAAFEATPKARAI